MRASLTLIGLTISVLAAPAAYGGIVQGLARRSALEVCSKWAEETRERATQSNSTGKSPCDPGAIDPVAEEDALRSLNFYRWLVGLSPVSIDPAKKPFVQAAARLFHENHDLEHEPPTHWTCYSQDAARGAGSSNIGLGYRSSAITSRATRSSFLAATKSRDLHRSFWPSRDRDRSPSKSLDRERSGPFQ